MKVASIGHVVQRLASALEQHACLVSDTEPPSEWTRTDPSVQGLDRKLT